MNKKYSWYLCLKVMEINKETQQAGAAFKHLCIKLHYLGIKSHSQEQRQECNTISTAFCVGKLSCQCFILPGTLELSYCTSESLTGRRHLLKNITRCFAWMSLQGAKQCTLLTDRGEKTHIWTTLNNLGLCWIKCLQQNLMFCLIYR